MSDLFSRICEDEDEYERACLIFGQKVRYNNGPDCYGTHAKRIIKKMYELGYGNISKLGIQERLRTGEFPIKRNKNVN